MIFEHGWSCYGDTIRCQSSERWTAILLPREKQDGGLNTRGKTLPNARDTVIPTPLRIS